MEEIDEVGYNPIENKEVKVGRVVTNCSKENDMLSTIESPVLDINASHKIKENKIESSDTYGLFCNKPGSKEDKLPISFLSSSLLYSQFEVLLRVY